MNNKLIAAIAAIAVVMLIIGCQPRGSTSVEVAPEEPAAEAPLEEPVSEPTATISTKTAEKVVEPVTKTIKTAAAPETEKKFVSPEPKMLTGVVYEIEGTTQTRTMGTIRPDGELNGYKFVTDLPLRRLDRVSFNIDIYDTVTDIHVISPREVPKSSVTGYQGQTVYKEGKNTVIIGVVSNVRTTFWDRVTGYTGVVRPADSFTSYPFDSRQRFLVGDQVKLVLNPDLETLSMEKMA